VSEERGFASVAKQTRYDRLQSVWGLEFKLQFVRGLEALFRQVFSVAVTRAARRIRGGSGAGILPAAAPQGAVIPAQAGIQEDRRPCLSPHQTGESWNPVLVFHLLPNRLKILPLRHDIKAKPVTPLLPQIADLTLFLVVIASPTVFITFELYDEVSAIFQEADEIGIVFVS